eukprot:s237_g5.t1
MQDFATNHAHANFNLSISKDWATNVQALHTRCNLPEAEKMRRHLVGICHPCVAHALRPGRCYKGSSCSHCHFCSTEQAQKRRKQIQAEGKERKRIAREMKKVLDEVDVASLPQDVPKSFWL